MPDLKCDCGKLIARFDGERLYLWCKNCKREIPLEPTKKANGTIEYVPRKPIKNYQSH